MPVEPYQRFVPGQGCAPNDASEPQVPLVNGTARLGSASSKCGSMRSSRRWNRLISPHGVFHVPNSRVSVSEAAVRAVSSVSAPARVAMYVCALTCAAAADGATARTARSAQ